jgi:hypothetical protein
MKKIKLTYGNLLKSDSDGLPLLVVYGGINVGGIKSGVYMWDYVLSLQERYDIWVANSHSIPGLDSYNELKAYIKDNNIKITNEIIYLFSGGYKPGKQVLQSFNSNFFLTFLVDIWMGNTSVGAFYTEYAKSNPDKTRYYYTSGGSQNPPVRDEISGLVTSIKGTSHMKTNDPAVTYLSNLYPPKRSTPPPITGTVVDSTTLQPIPYPKVKYFPIYNPPISNTETPPDLIDMYKAKSISGEGNDKGEFSIEIPSVSEYLSINSANSSLIIPNSTLEVTITANGYEVIDTTPLKGDGTFKSDLGVIKLKSFKVERREAHLSTNEITEVQLEILVQEQNEVFQKKFIEIQTEKLLKTIKGKLIPFIINQIADLGIPNPIGLLKKTKEDLKKEKAKLKQAAKDKKKSLKDKKESLFNSGSNNEPLSNEENT